MNNVGCTHCGVRCGEIHTHKVRACTSPVGHNWVVVDSTGESDPTGRVAGEPGAKLDQGKNRLGLVLFGFSRALQAVGGVGTYGAKKYSDNGWMEVPDGVSRYTDAMLRHLMSEAQGERIDPTTDLMHAAQTAWNALARLELMLREEQKTN